MSTFDYFLDLPIPVLYDILLILKPRELRSIIGNKKILNLVKLPEFKRLYDIKHNIDSFMLGRKTIKNGRKLEIEKDKLKFVIHRPTDLELVIFKNYNYAINDYALAKAHDLIIGFEQRNDELVAFYLRRHIRHEQYAEITWLDYGDGKFTFDYDNVPEKSGVLLEIFRNILIEKNKNEWLPIDLETKLAFPYELYKLLKMIYRTFLQ